MGQNSCPNTWRREFIFYEIPVFIFNKFCLAALFGSTKWGCEGADGAHVAVGNTSGQLLPGRPPGPFVNARGLGCVEGSPAPPQDDGGGRPSCSSPTFCPLGCQGGTQAPPRVLANGLDFVDSLTYSKYNFTSRNRFHGYLACVYFANLGHFGLIWSM